MTDEPTPPEGADIDDETWLAALAGRARVDDARAEVQQALQLRAALRREAARSTAPLPAAGDADALVARARREGLLRRRWCASCAARAAAWLAAWHTLTRPLPLAGGALALLLLAWVSLPLLGPPSQDGAPTEDSVQRAGPDGLVLLRDADPAARRDRIADALQAAGAQVQRYERLGRQGLDAQWPLPASPALAQALASERLAMPAGGVLRLEVEGLP